jgi:electron transport complex protein RnfG
MKLISEVLPRELYDNDLLKDALQLPPSVGLGNDEASTAYRASKAGKSTALVFEAVAADGYSGKIRLLLAVAADGSLLGVRVTQHRETPGLGDYIDPRKDKNKERPWIPPVRRSLAGNRGRPRVAGQEGQWPLRFGGRRDGDAARRRQGRAQGLAVRRRKSPATLCSA